MKNVILSKYIHLASCNFIRKICLILVLLVLISNSTLAQGILPYSDFIQQVMQAHPVATQAKLQQEYGKTERLAARGKFDPKLSSSFNEKQFKDKDYYQLFDAKINVPTWLGLSVNAGYENATGYYVNPQLQTSDNGLWYLGLEANLLQGLLLDERRAGLKQAKILMDVSENKSETLKNNLLYSASLAYINWQLTWKNGVIIAETVSLDSTYFEATRTSFLNGEKPAIDTLEAHLIYQDALALQIENNLDQQVAQRLLTRFLWQNEQPTKPKLYLPQSTPLNNTPKSDTISIHYNTELREKVQKQQLYKIERRLKVEKLKPKLKVKYNPLLATSKKSITPTYSEKNYKWGFLFSMPLLLRQERASVRKSNIKIEKIEAEIADKKNMLTNKKDAILLKIDALQELINLQARNMKHYKTLLMAERERMKIGESSVFMLNKRQEKYLKSQTKFTALKAKLQVEILNYKLITNTFTVR